MSLQKVQESSNEKDIDHTNHVSRDISKLFLNQKYSDIAFVIEGKKMYAHKTVLAARGECFAKLFDIFQSEIQVKETSCLSFKRFLKYIYTGKLSLNDMDIDESRELLKLALEYQIEDLVYELINSCEGTDTDTSTDISIDTFTDTSTVSTKKGHTPNITINSVVIYALNGERLFCNGKSLDERSCTKHAIGTNGEGIIIIFKYPTKLNWFQFKLWDGDQNRCFSYIVLITDEKNTQKLVSDYSKYWCRSWQRIVFDTRVVKEIKISGVMSTEWTMFGLSRYFAISDFSCGILDNEHHENGFWIPKTNIATESHGTTVKYERENIHWPSPKMLRDDIDFEYKIFNDICSKFTLIDGDKTWIIVQFSQPIIIYSFRFYINSAKKFKYAIESTCDHHQAKDRKWHMIDDKRNQFHGSGWQQITFPKRLSMYIRIIGIKCDDEKEHIFQITSFMCP